MSHQSSSSHHPLMTLVDERNLSHRAYTASQYLVDDRLQRLSSSSRRRKFLMTMPVSLGSGANKADNVATNTTLDVISTSSSKNKTRPMVTGWEEDYDGLEYRTGLFQRSDAAGLKRRRKQKLKVSKVPFRASPSQEEAVENHVKRQSLAKMVRPVLWKRKGVNAALINPNTYMQHANPGAIGSIFINSKSAPALSPEKLIIGNGILHRPIKQHATPGTDAEYDAAQMEEQPLSSLYAVDAADDMVQCNLTIPSKCRPSKLQQDTLRSLREKLQRRLPNLERFRDTFDCDDRDDMNHTAICSATERVAAVMHNISVNVEQIRDWSMRPSIENTKAPIMKPKKKAMKGSGTGNQGKRKNRAKLKAGGVWIVRKPIDVESQSNSGNRTRRKIPHADKTISPAPDEAQRVPGLVIRPNWVNERGQEILDDNWNRFAADAHDIQECSSPNDDNDGDRYEDDEFYDDDEGDGDSVGDGSDLDCDGDGDEGGGYKTKSAKQASKAAKGRKRRGDAEAPEGKTLKRRSRVHGRAKRRPRRRLRTKQLSKAMLPKQQARMSYQRTRPQETMNVASVNVTWSAQINESTVGLFSKHLLSRSSDCAGSEYAAKSVALLNRERSQRRLSCAAVSAANDEFDNGIQANAASMQVRNSVTTLGNGQIQADNAVLRVSDGSGRSNVNVARTSMNKQQQQRTWSSTGRYIRSKIPGEPPVFEYCRSRNDIVQLPPDMLLQRELAMPSPVRPHRGSFRSHRRHQSSQFDESRGRGSGGGSGGGNGNGRDAKYLITDQLKSRSTIRSILSAARTMSMSEMSMKHAMKRGGNVTSSPLSIGDGGPGGGLAPMRHSSLPGSSLSKTSLLPMYGAKHVKDIYSNNVPAHVLSVGQAQPHFEVVNAVATNVLA